MEHKNQSDARAKKFNLCHGQLNNDELAEIWAGVREAAARVAEAEPQLQHLLTDVVISRDNMAHGLAARLARKLAREDMQRDELEPLLCGILTENHELVRSAARDMQAIVDRDPVTVAIGTEGTAPVLARQIKTKVEGILEPNLGDLAALAGRMRNAAAARLAPRARRDLWRWVFNDAPRQLFTSGAERDAAKLINPVNPKRSEPSSAVSAFWPLGVFRAVPKLVMVVITALRLETVQNVLYSGSTHCKDRLENRYVTRSKHPFEFTWLCQITRGNARCGCNVGRC